MVLGGWVLCGGGPLDPPPPPPPGPPPPWISTFLVLPQSSFSFPPKVDRHLFALYVVSRGKDISAPFLEQVIGMPWTLSTSQIPWRMAPKYVYKGVDRDKILVSAGGFGPVDPNGYGICYAFMDDKWLVMHVSSRLSCPTTDSEKMLAALHQAYKDMAALCLSETDP